MTELMIGLSIGFGAGAAAAGWAIRWWARRAGMARVADALRVAKL